MEMIQKIFEIEELGRLEEYLAGFPDVEELRAALFAGFLGVSRYRDAGEWNRAVRLCEALAIVGWGDKEPLEAVRGTYFNGNPNTYFINRDARPRFLDAVWSKRKEGFAIDFSRSKLHGSPDAPSPGGPLPEGVGAAEAGAPSLRSQRNWIAKNPILITRGLANCYENSRPVIESMEKELMPELNRRMRPWLYGRAIDRIVLHCCFSFYDDYHCKTNYIIADESLRLKQKDFYPALLAMFPEQEIEDNGYYLRNRFTYGPFRADTGTIRVTIVFEKEFSFLPQRQQKQILCDYFLQAAGQCARRLSRKIDYDFDLMLSDLSAILRQWAASPLPE